MSGLNPEVEAQRKIDAELVRIEQQRATPRKGSLAARVAQARKNAEKRLHEAEVELARCRAAESLLRAEPTLTARQLISLVKKGKRGR